MHDQPAYARSPTESLLDLVQGCVVRQMGIQHVIRRRAHARCADTGGVIGARRAPSRSCSSVQSRSTRRAIYVKVLPNSVGIGRPAGTLPLAKYPLLKLLQDEPHAVLCRLVSALIQRSARRAPSFSWMDAISHLAAVAKFSPDLATTKIRIAETR